jgi:hypothetical protein
MAAVDVESVLAELKTKYPEPDYELVPVKMERVGLLVLRNPSHAEDVMLRKQVSMEGAGGSATENLFVRTCVYPSAAEVQRLVLRYPALVRNEKIQRAMGYLSGQLEALEGKG